VSANPGIPLGKPTDVPREPQATISRPALTVVHSPAEQTVHGPGESAEDDGLAGMLAGLPAIAIHARREQRRLRIGRPGRRHPQANRAVPCPT
jgi:hypothetical protein